jgi:hypothetical protein
LFVGHNDPLAASVALSFPRHNPARQKHVKLSIFPAVIIEQLHLDTFALKENWIMAEDTTLEEKERRFDEALDKLQRTVEAGGGVPNEIFNEFLVAADDYRRDMRYKGLLESARNDFDRIL